MLVWEMFGSRGELLHNFFQSSREGEWNLPVIGVILCEDGAAIRKPGLLV
jgi:hypothetical protein